MTRMQLAATAEFARAHGMRLEFTAIPMDYPRVSPLDFSRANMGSLFNCGLKCAEQGRLWTTVDEAYSSANYAMSRWRLDRTSAGAPTQTACPLDTASRSDQQLRAARDTTPAVQAGPVDEIGSARIAPLPDLVH